MQMLKKWPPGMKKLLTLASRGSLHVRAAPGKLQVNRLLSLQHKQPQADVKEVAVSCAEAAISAAQQQAAPASPDACDQVQLLSTQADADPKVQPQVQLNKVPAWYETAVQPEADSNGVSAAAQLPLTQLASPASFASASSFAEQLANAETQSGLFEVAALLQPESSPALAEVHKVSHEIMGSDIGEHAMAETDGQQPAAVASEVHMGGSNFITSGAEGAHLAALTKKDHGEAEAIAAVGQQSSVKASKLHSILSAAEAGESPLIAAFTGTGSRDKAALPVAAVAHEDEAMGSSMAHAMSASAAPTGRHAEEEQALGLPALGKVSSRVVFTAVPVLGKDLSRVVIYSSAAPEAVTAGMLMSQVL